MVIPETCRAHQDKYCLYAFLCQNKMLLIKLYWKWLISISSHTTYATKIKF